MKAHPFFGRLDWDRLYHKRLPSPLKQSVEVVSQARAGRAPRHPLNTVDRELAPSYLARQSSALVQDWDYVAPGGNGKRAAEAVGAIAAIPPRAKSPAERSKSPAERSKSPAQRA